MIRRYVAAYVGAALVMASLDAVWLTLTNQALYHANLGAILIQGFRPVPAIAFYVLYLVGVVVFAIAPARADNHRRDAAWRGALFGLVAYSTYDLTNQATLAVWSTRVTFADLAWGTALTAISAVAGLSAAKLVSRD